jgi:VWFA-related protein
MKIRPVLLAAFITGFLWTPIADTAQAKPGQAVSGVIAAAVSDNNPAAFNAPESSVYADGTRANNEGRGSESNGSQTGSTAPAAGNGNAITLDVVVTDKSGAPVAGLQPGDFKLLDKKQAQSIVSVQAANGLSATADPPAEAILVVDAVNAGLTTIDSERQMLVRFLQENGGELALPTSLAVLSDQGLTVKNPPTRDGKVLADFINANIPGLRPISADDWDGNMEREQLSLKALDVFIAHASRGPGRKLLIWLSPGWRLQTSGNWVASPKDQQMLYNKIVTLSTAMRAARVTLYSIDPSGIDSELTFQQIYEAYLKGVDTPKHVDYGYLLLQVLATQTGGKPLIATGDLAKVMDQCMADAKAYYVLTFNPPPAAYPNEYHSIEVQVDKPGLKARTRTGYYARPIATGQQFIPGDSPQKPAN